MTAPKRGIGRVIRAFFQATAMTLRGEKLPPPLTPEQQIAARYPQAAVWLAETITRVKAVEQAAAGIDLDALKVRVDRREMRARTILEAIRFRAVQEYPFMLLNPSDYRAMGFQAIHANDVYLLERLHEADGLPEGVKTALTELRDHLNTLQTILQTIN